MKKRVDEGWKRVGADDVYSIRAHEKNEPIPLAELRSWLLADDNLQRIQDHLSWYFSQEYSGKYFEWFVGHSDPRVFTPWDILAVEALSVSVPTETASWLLNPKGDCHHLLAASNQRMAPGQDSLWTCDEAFLGDGQPLSDLYTFLRKKDGLGPVTTSKLLATKFPNLVPIRDSKVETLLGLEKSREWWAPIRSLFTEQGQSLSEYLDKLDVPEEFGTITTLRRLDVILWMEAKARRIETGKVPPRRFS